MRYLLFLCLLLPQFLAAQGILSGRIWDDDQKPIFGANVYLLHDSEKGAITDLEGKFSLEIEDRYDSLIVSYIGYTDLRLSLSSIDFGEMLELRLKKNSYSLETVQIMARDPITDQFSTVMIKKMDIYLNPVAQGDPLKAITALPASTTIDETANPSLRGSSADRSRVVLNGVPIYNPVRSSQLNNQGFFSIFNPEIMDRQYIYASNPPLTYGNTSAGLVEIQTLKELPTNQIQLSTGLSNLGLMLSRKLKAEDSFFQLYGNYQFSEAYIGLNRANIPRLQSFETRDAGLHFSTKLGKKMSFSSMNYFIDEGAAYLTHMPSYEGPSVSGQKRGFSVNSLSYTGRKTVLSLNQGIDAASSQFSFANLRSNRDIRRFFLGLNQKWILSEDLNIQYGGSFDRQGVESRDSIPEFYYASAPDAPSLFSAENLDNSNLEAYAFAKWEINDQLNGSLGLRKNVPLQDQPDYLSYQISVKYQFKPAHHLLLSGGKYHNYASPSFFRRNFDLQSSYQWALDYQWMAENTQVSAAVYYKDERGNLAQDFFFSWDKTLSTGVEFALTQNIGDYLSINFSNTYLRQRVIWQENEYEGPLNFPFIFKSSISYNQPGLVSIALSAFFRPGTNYTGILEGRFEPSNGFYEPIFEESLYGRSLNNYSRLDLNISRYFRFGNKALIVFLNVGNLMNQQNQRSALYNFDYSSLSYEYFQLRSIYAGLVWQLNS